MFVTSEYFDDLHKSYSPIRTLLHLIRFYVFSKIIIIWVRGVITVYCRKCGTKLGNSAKFCTFCGEPTGEPPVRHVPVPQQEKSSFQTWKLVSGIITIVFCTFIFTLAGCASILSDYAGTHYSVMDSKAACSALSIACGIVSIATRARPDIKGDVAIIVLGIMVCVLSVEGHDPIQAVWMIACSIVAAACIHSKSTMY